jgi:hypothetical protein
LQQLLLGTAKSHGPEATVAQRQGLDPLAGGLLIPQLASWLLRGLGGVGGQAQQQRQAAA